MSPAKDTVWAMTPNMAMAKQLAIREVPSLVYDAVNLEGVAMTLPEIQTILDGVTVGGHRISDQNMVINQADTWKYLFSMIGDGRFKFSKAVALELHAIAGKEEALGWGAFRTGNVTISGSDYEPPSPERLDDEWLKIQMEVGAIHDIYDRAVTAFLKFSMIFPLRQDLRNRFISLVSAVE